MNEAQQQLATFVSTYTPTRFGKGQLIARPGDTIEKIHYISEGSVIQYEISAAGNVAIVDTLQVGTALFLPYALDNQPVDYFFEANAPLAAKLIPRQQFIDYLTNTPAAVHELLLQSYRGTRAMLRRTAHLMTGSAKHRLMYELLAAADRVGEPAPNNAVFIHLSESDLASYTGLSRETVNRMARTLKTAGLVEVSYQGILLTSPAKLAALLHELS